ncbi:MAG: PilZ domain-containing protein [Acidobacteriota bacterium]
MSRKLRSIGRAIDIWIQGLDGRALRALAVIMPRTRKNIIVDKTNDGVIMGSTRTLTALESPWGSIHNAETKPHFRVEVLRATIVPTEPKPRPLVEHAPDQMSAYFLDLEGLLSRIDSATTYYQILGLDRDDGQEKIKSSFQQLLNLLYPPYVVGRTMPAEITPRIERAFSKASQAFGVLASFARRKDYDGALLSIATKPAVAKATKRPQEDHPQTASKQFQVSQPQAAQNGGESRSDSAAVAAENYDLNISINQRGEVYRESAKAKQGDNRRRCERFKVSIPARVTGYDRNGGKWHEMTETIDVSRTGVRLRLRRRVKHGSVLFLTLPLPAKLRSHGFTDQSYNVYTLVRRVETPKQGVRAIGVEFLGEHPPKGFLDKPWAIFRSNRWGGNERRRPDREERAETVSIEYFDESMQSIRREQATTENVSRSGLRISGTAAPPEFDVIMVTCPRLKFEGLAALRSRYRGKDGVERLCVQLVDKEWPFEDDSRRFAPS